MLSYKFQPFNKISKHRKEWLTTIEMISSEIIKKIVSLMKTSCTQIHCLFGMTFVCHQTHPLHSMQPILRVLSKSMLHPLNYKHKH